MGDQRSMTKLGPVGICTRNQWDDVGRDKIVRIFIYHNKDSVSLRFQYEENGALVMSNWRGSKTTDKFDIVELDYPTEYITGVSGHACHRLHSITFISNIKQYGPFGSFTNNQDEFAFHLGRSRNFNGFYGSTDSSGISSFGIYSKQITTFPGTVLHKMVVLKESGNDITMSKTFGTRRMVVPKVESGNDSTFSRNLGTNTEGNCLIL